METLPGSTKTEMVVNRKCKFARTSSHECGAWPIFTFSSSLRPPLLSATSSSSHPSILPFTLLSGAPYSPSVGFTSPHPWPQFSLTFWRDPGFCDGINFRRARYPVLSCLWLSLWSSAQPSSSLLSPHCLVISCGWISYSCRIKGLHAWRNHRDMKPSLPQEGAEAEGDIVFPAGTQTLTWPEKKKKRKKELVSLPNMTYLYMRSHIFHSWAQSFFQNPVDWVVTVWDGPCHT